MKSLQAGALMLAMTCSATASDLPPSPALPPSVEKFSTAIGDAFNASTAQEHEGVMRDSPVAGPDADNPPNATVPPALRIMERSAQRNIKRAKDD